MTIDVKLLEQEKEKLTKEFNELKSQIAKFENDLGLMKSNLNAVHGAIQQTQRLINMSLSNKDSINKKLEEATK